MKVFISQSGTRSLAIAEAILPFIRKLLPDAEPWMAPTGIAKGTRWGLELAKGLKDAGAGLICLTPENAGAAWILFEAGALSREPENRVWTLLFDVEEGRVGPQLAQFQNTKATKKDIRAMIDAMNEVVSSKPRPKEDIDELFEGMWPRLEARLEEIRAMPPDAPPPPSIGDDEKLAEILATVRDIGKQSTRDDTRDSWRIAKTLGMLSILYKAVTNELPPSMNEITEQQQSYTELRRQLEREALLSLMIKDEPGSAARGDGSITGQLDGN